jgi:hypothetical protein
MRLFSSTTECCLTACSIARQARRIIRLRDGEIRLTEYGEHQHFGARTERCTLSVTIEVLHPQFYADAAFGGTVGAGAAYIRGLWRCSDLTSLVRIMVVNRDLMDVQHRLAELNPQWEQQATRLAAME